MNDVEPPARVEPFSIAIEDDVLSDLRARIHNTRWPDQIPGVGWEQGTDLGYLRSLSEYWADEFDWRAQEADLNRFAHFRAEVDGVHIHFVHEKARGGDAIPLVLTHGWPSSFVELLPLVPLLTDPSAHGIDGPAFDVVIPSLPGYGFSERPARTGGHVARRIGRDGTAVRPLEGDLAGGGSSPASSIGAIHPSGGHSGCLSSRGIMVLGRWCSGIGVYRAKQIDRRDPGHGAVVRQD